MRTTLRQARESCGVSMSELARRLGVHPASVSTLELNDERGTAKAATIERALAALGLKKMEFVLPAADVDEIVNSTTSAASRDDVCRLAAQRLAERLRDRPMSQLQAALQLADVFHAGTRGPLVNIGPLWRQARERRTTSRRS
ncbi:MAG: helix-turn-helix transcriptional regulator [Ilumatobacteraceae bacterium]